VELFIVSTKEAHGKRGWQISAPLAITFNDPVTIFAFASISLLDGRRNDEGRASHHSIVNEERSCHGVVGYFAGVAKPYR
ncbi:MAG: hypothetical protein JXR53_07760, partial [Bacteroidales bacterium]|nr:hypothetical protein [Bacteroidales bacterium]